MAWNKATRKKYKRADDYRQNNLTDAEWDVISPLLPEPCGRGRPRTTDLSTRSSTCWHPDVSGG